MDVMSEKGMYGSSVATSIVHEAAATGIEAVVAGRRSGTHRRCAPLDPPLARMVRRTPWLLSGMPDGASTGSGQRVAGSLGLASARPMAWRPITRCGARWPRMGNCAPAGRVAGGVKRHNGKAVSVTACLSACWWWPVALHAAQTQFSFIS